MPTLYERASLLANLATAAMLVVAGYQLYQAAELNTKALEGNRVQLSVALVQQGLSLEREYNEGKKDIRDVFSHHYGVFMYRSAGLLHEPIWKPMDQSLCTFLLQDPRAKAYWESVDKSSFDKAYADHIDDLFRRGKC